MRLIDIITEENTQMRLIDLLNEENTQTDWKALVDGVSRVINILKTPQALDWAFQERGYKNFKKLVQKFDPSIKGTTIFDYWDAMEDRGVKLPSLKNMTMRFDLSKIRNVHWANVRSEDYPVFTDAYIDSADYMGGPMTDEQLRYLEKWYDRWAMDSLNDYINGMMDQGSRDMYDDWQRGP